MKDKKSTPGLPPHKTNTGFCGDPGVESAKSIFFGVDGGGGEVGTKVYQVAKSPTSTSSLDIGKPTPNAFTAKDAKGATEAE